MYAAKAVHIDVVILHGLQVVCTSLDYSIFTGPMAPVPPIRLSQSRRSVAESHGPRKPNSLISRCSYISNLM
jgi:preprotein translocase subunit Sec63